jgi:hypothetical protein
MDIAAANYNQLAGASARRSAPMLLSDYLKTGWDDARLKGD